MTAAHITFWTFGLNALSAIFGITGSWLMSQRYARQFRRNVLFACIAPFLYFFGRGDRVRKSIEATVKENWDFPDYPSAMALGLALLFLAFLLQIGSTFLDLLG